MPNNQNQDIHNDIHFEGISSSSHNISHILHSRDYANAFKSTHLSDKQENNIPSKYWKSIEPKQLKSYNRQYFLPMFLGNSTSHILVPKFEETKQYFSKFLIDISHIDFPNSRSMIICKNLFNAYLITSNIDDVKIMKHFINNNMLMAETVLWSNETEKEFNKLFYLTKEPANDSLRLLLPIEFKKYIDNLKDNLIPYFEKKYQRFHPIKENLSIIDFIIGNKFADVIGNKYTLSDIVYDKNIKVPKVYINPNMVKRGNYLYYQAYLLDNNNKLGFVISRNFYVPNKQKETDNLNTINFIKNVRDNFTIAILERAKDQEHYEKLEDFLISYFNTRNKKLIALTLQMRHVYQRILNLIRVNDFPFDVYKCRTMLDLFPNGDNPIIKHYYDLFISYIECPYNYAYFTKKDIYGNNVDVPTTRFFQILQYLMNKFETNYNSSLTNTFVDNIMMEFTNISKQIFKNFESPRNPNNFYIEVIHAETPDMQTIYIPQCLIDAGYFKEGQQGLLTGNPVHNSDAVQIVTFIGWNNYVLGVSQELMVIMARDYDGDELQIGNIPIVTIVHNNIANNDLFNKINFGLKPIVTRISENGIITNPNEDNKTVISLLDFINTDPIIGIHECKYSNQVKTVNTIKLSIVDTIRSYLTAKEQIGIICTPTRLERSLAYDLASIKEANQNYFRNANFVINTKGINVLDQSYIDECNNLIIESYQKSHEFILGEPFKFNENEKYKSSIIGKVVRGLELHEQFLKGTRNLITMDESEYLQLKTWIGNLENFQSFSYKTIINILDMIFENKNHDIKRIDELAKDESTNNLIIEIFATL